MVQKKRSDLLKHPIFCSMFFHLAFITTLMISSIFALLLATPAFARSSIAEFPLLAATTKQIKRSVREKKRQPLLINGAGASFPYILYSKWFSEYQKVDPSVRINYRSIGSGGGIRQFLTGTLDFGATDVPIVKRKMRTLKSPPLHIPTALGAVVISYNLPTLKDKDTLRLTPMILADIYQGKIKKWNHKKILSVNPNLSLPDRQIVPIYRADGSGTTAVMTEYLAHFSPEWLQKAGKGKSVNWPTGIGGKGNEGVMGLIRKMPGAIGYIAWSYAANSHFPTAAVQNTSKHFVKVSHQNVSNSATQIWKKHHDLFKPLIVAKGTDTYPLSSYTYLIVKKKMSTNKGSALVRFLKWAVQKGQVFCRPLHYIPLPKSVTQAILKQIDSIHTLKDN